MREVVRVRTQNTPLRETAPIKQRNVSESEQYVNLDCANSCLVNLILLPATVPIDDACALIH